MISLNYFFFFNDTATTEIYTLSLHDALPIFDVRRLEQPLAGLPRDDAREHEQHGAVDLRRQDLRRSEEHTSELQSRQYLVCRLLLEKKNTLQSSHIYAASILLAQHFAGVAD